jgi:hypothetical protein
MALTRHRTALVHIGFVKTGTSSIQSFLNHNREQLLAQGYDFPLFAGIRNQTTLVSYSCNAKRNIDFRRRKNVLTVDQVMRFREEYAQRMERHFAGSTCPVAIFSSEHLSLLLDSQEEVSRLKSLLSRFFNEIRIVCYIRRQDEAMISLYSTALRVGRTEAEILSEKNYKTEVLDYSKLVDRWAPVFGRDNIVPHVYGEDTAQYGSVVDHFRETYLPNLKSWDTPESANSSLNAAAQKFLLQLNKEVPRDHNNDNPLRYDLQAQFDSLFSGAGRLPSSGDADEFMKKFQESNEVVRQAWFADKEQLFGPRKLTLPDVEDSADLTASEALDIGLKLWINNQNQKIELRTRLTDAVRKGKKANERRADIEKKDMEIKRLSEELRERKERWNLKRRVQKFLGL